MDFKGFIREKTKEYKAVGSIECPAFNNEKVYFTRAGFNHLIRKDRIQREIPEQIKRLTLLQFVPGIIRRARKRKDLRRGL